MEDFKIEAVSNDHIVTLKMDLRYAMIMFEWLSTHFEDGDDLPFEHPADEQTINQLFGSLQRCLAEPFEKDYSVKLTLAKDAVVKHFEG